MIAMNAYIWNNIDLNASRRLTSINSILVIMIFMSMVSLLALFSFMKYTGLRRWWLLLLCLSLLLQNLVLTLFLELFILADNLWYCYLIIFLLCWRCWCPREVSSLLIFFSSFVPYLVHVLNIYSWSRRTILVSIHCISYVVLTLLLKLIESGYRGMLIFIRRCGAAYSHQGFLHALSLVFLNVTF